MAHREVASAKNEGEIRPSGLLRAFCILLLVVWSVLLVRTVVAMRIDPLLTFPLLGLMATLALGLSFPRASRALVSAIEKVRDPVFVFACALIAASISYWVVRSPMNARPLSIDGHVYLQQARALSHLRFGTPLPSPRLAFSARFLFEGADGRLHGVFPPGFPLFLAPFVRLSIPLLSGPVMAALLVVAQHDLARALKLDAWTARLSILLALPSFARAVETADLLSHAFVAVLATFALSSALRLVSRGELRPEEATALLSQRQSYVRSWLLQTRMRR